MSYKERLECCRRSVHEFLTAFLNPHSGRCPKHGADGCPARAIRWDKSYDPNDVVTWIVRMAELVAAMRSVPPKEPDFQRQNGRNLASGQSESPHRAMTVLYNLARGHALIRGRSQVHMEDLPIIADVAVSTMGTEAGRVFKALVEGPSGMVTVTETMRILGVKHPETANGFMKQLAARGVLEVVTSPNPTC